MKRTLVFLLFCFLYLSSSAGIKDSLSLGLSWNHRTKESINAEIYVIGRNVLMESWNTKAGLAFRSYALNFDGVRNLGANSIGFNFEETVFPFKKIFFLGLRFDISADFLTRTSKDKISAERGYKMPLLYSDGMLSLVAGADLKITKGLNLRLYVLQGVEDRGINNKILFSGMNDEDIIRDDTNHYPTQLNIGIDFKF